jgi:hypothetical protein
MPTRRSVEQAALTESLEDLLRPLFAARNFSFVETRRIAEQIARFLCEHSILEELTRELDATQRQLAGVRIVLGLTGLESRPLSAFVRDLKTERDALLRERAASNAQGWRGSLRRLLGGKSSRAATDRSRSAA